MKNLKTNGLVAAIFISSLMTTGCENAVISGATNQGGGSGGGGGGGGSSSQGTSDVKRIASLGVGVNFNGLTGGPSSMALHPTTRLPAVVYYDKGIAIGSTVAVGALKYAFQDSLGNWHIEIVDSNYGTVACGTAGSTCIGAPNNTNLSHSVVKLAFKADGTPAIAYSYGQSLAGTSKFIRYATRSTNTDGSANWSFETALTVVPGTVAVAATAEPLKSLNMVFDDEGRPHITVLEVMTTQINSRLRYAMRKTDGTWTTSSHGGYTVNPGTYNPITLGTTAAAGQFMRQSGMAICPIDGMPMMTAFENDTAAAGGGEPWLLRCTTLDADGACTAWEGLNVSEGCTGTGCFGGLTNATNSGQYSDLTIDPVTNRAVVALYSTANPLTTSVVGTPNTGDCSASLTTLNSSANWVGATHATANTGLNGIKVIATANEVLIAAAVSTTSFVFSRSVGASLSGGNFTAANTMTIEAVAAVAAGEQMGFAYDSTDSTLYTSYAALPAAAAGVVGNDLRVASVLPSDVTNSALNRPSVTTVDQSVQVFPNTAVPVLHAAKAPNGLSGYAYLFTEQGTVGPNSHLYYGIKGGTATDPAFGEKLVVNAIQGATTFTVGAYPWLDYDSSSNPRIAFIDAPSATTGRLYIAKSSNRGASFSLEHVDGNGTASNAVGRFSSMANSGGNSAIAYYDFTTANLRLKFGKKSATGPWRKSGIEGFSGGSAAATCTNGAITDSGSYAVLRLTSTGRPVIAFQSTIGGVKYLRLALAAEAITSDTFTWTCQTLDSNASVNSAEGLGFVLDSSDRPHIVHMTSALNIRYVTCASDVVTCVAAGSTVFSTTSSPSFTSEFVGSAGSGSAVITSRPEIQVTSAGTAYASWYSASDRALLLATKTSTGSWTSESIETQDPDWNFPSSAGAYGVLLLNDSNLPMMFYRSLENWLKYFSRELVD